MWTPGVFRFPPQNPSSPSPVCGMPNKDAVTSFLKATAPRSRHRLSHSTVPARLIRNWRHRGRQPALSGPLASTRPVCMVKPSQATRSDFQSHSTGSPPLSEQSDMSKSQGAKTFAITDRSRQIGGPPFWKTTHQHQQLGAAQSLGMPQPPSRVAGIPELRGIC
jgi:hypothetical protein